MAFHDKIDWTGVDWTKTNAEIAANLGGIRRETVSRERVRLGHAKVYPRPSDRIGELETILACARDLEVRPVLGVRARLATKGAGKWIESAGDRSKFGLTTAEIVAVVDRLKEAGMLDCLQLLHFHIGSQVPDILIVKRAVREAARQFETLFMNELMKSMRATTLATPGDGQGGEGGAGDALHGAKLERAAGHQGAGVAGRHARLARRRSLFPRSPSASCGVASRRAGRAASLLARGRSLRRGARNKNQYQYRACLRVRD